MKEKESKFYITTAIDYVNDKPHLGHALEKVQADVLARYAREKFGPENVFFLTGTDEHGVKVARAAEKAGQPPEKFAAGISDLFRALRTKLNLSFDRFIRTTDAETHYPGVEKMWRALRERGDIYKKNYRGLYCVGHEAFITEKDLVDGKCGDHQRAPEVVEEENYFFRLTKYAPDIKAAIETGRFKILPETRRNEILALLEQGLEDVSFSRPRRSLSWGIPVPDDPDQTIYVWADALVNYISAVGYGRDAKEFQKWWPAEAQVIGKDILRFHAAIWPAMLLSANLPLPEKLLVHGFMTVDGQKMSKTVGNVVDPVAMADKYGPDALRYYLLKEIPSGEDGDFSESKLTALYNSDLANGIGNLTSRVLKMAVTHGAWPAKWKEPDFAEFGAHLEKFQLNRAVASVWEEVRRLDEKIQREEPFKLVKTEPDRAKGLIADYVAELRRITEFLEFILPETAAKIESAILGRKVPPILFPRIEAGL